MRNYTEELKSRIEFIRSVINDSGARGIVFANSGGKDAALTGILCKMACDDTIGLVLPCGSKRNLGEDKDDALKLAEKFSIATRIIDLNAARDTLIASLGGAEALGKAALINIAPRLRMITLFATANSENRLVAGTGNRSETYMGYFTKWGDGAYDFNPIGDLTVTEIYEFLRFLNTPESIIAKAPSAGLFDGQTDEGDMGVTYSAIDKFIFTGEGTKQDTAIIERYHKSSEHKRRMPLVYGGR